MAQDMPNGHLNGGGGRKLLKAMDFSKTLIWDSIEDLDCFAALVANPPNHSVVVHIDPVVAKGILRVANDKNRPISPASVQTIVDAHNEGDFSLTGDTIKFSRKGRLLDGQYRLTASITAEKGFETHLVFGLDEKIFDILDRQRTRTAGDVLSISGVKNATIVAGAVRWVVMMEKGARGQTNRGMTPRHIRQLAMGPMKELVHYTGFAEQIRGAYKIPPTIAAALLFMISRGDKTIVESFVQDWLAGNRNYTRNKNFDVLVAHIQSVRNKNNGHLNRTVLAAALVQTFNHWHANIVSSSKALAWRKQYQFPKLAFDKQAFLHERERRNASDSSLPTLQERMLKALYKLQDKDGNVEVSVIKMAQESSVPERQVTYVLSTLKDDNLVHLSRKSQRGKHNLPAIWRLKEAGEALVLAAQ